MMQAKPLTFKAVVFDWDGTVCSSIGFIVSSLQHTAKALGREPFPMESCYRVIGLGWDDIIGILAPDLDDDGRARFRKAFSEDYFRHQKEVTPFPGMRALVEGLNCQGVPLAIATGKSRRGLNQVLEHLGMTALFTSTMTDTECLPKPNTEMIENIAIELGIEPNECVVVGDNPADLWMGINVGAQVIGVAWGAGREAQLREVGPVDVVNDVLTLAHYLGADETTLAAINAEIAASEAF